MTDFLKRVCYTGIRLRVGSDRGISWQPNKFAGNHGARFSLIDNDGLADMVLSKKPKGSWVKITRDSEVLCFEEGGPKKLGKLSSPPKLEFEKLNADPAEIEPGMIWSGPFDGEYHHFCGDRFWVMNVNNKRCHYKSVPEELRSLLERRKPLGGSFVVNPWGYVIALIEPQPLPKEAVEQWENFSREERRLLQIKQKGAKMLPIYITKWKSEWDIILEKPVDFSKPLSKQEEEEMMVFFSQFSGPSKQSAVPENQQESTEESVRDDVEEDWADDSDFFEEDALYLMYSPSDDTEND